MTLTTLGDLTSHFMLRRHNVALRTEMQRLSHELATGETANPIRHLTGDYAILADIEQRMVGNAAYRQARAEASTTTDAMQGALGGLQDMTVGLASSLMTTSDSGLLASGRVAADQARETLDRAVSLLNTRVAGRALFAGNEVAMPAMADAETIMADLRLAVAGMTTSAQIGAALDAWFNTPGGGFDTVAYVGSDMSVPPFRVAEGESVSLDLRADHAALRQSLKPIALAALAGDATLDMATRNAIYRAAGDQLFQAQDGLTALRADLGVTQARLEETGVRLASEKLALEGSRSGLLSVDPYDTATRLQEVQFNLESLYTLTVRMSRLSLTEYM